MRHFCYHLLAGLLLFAQLPACQQRPPDTLPVQQSSPDLFELSAGPGVPDGYSATIYRANFVLPGGGTLPVASGQLLTGSWGASGTVMPGARIPAPDSLEVLWFSYAADKFYEGHFLLPQQRMQALLRAGFWDTQAKRHDTYRQLTLSLLPTGGVVLWLTGGNRVLVGRYQATETDFDFPAFNPGAPRAEIVREVRGQMPPPVQQRVAAGQLSTQPWDAYLAQYPWQLAFSHPVQLYDYGVDYFSAERTNYPFASPLTGAGSDFNQQAFQQVLLAPSLKPIPRELYLFVQGPYGRRRQLRVDPFDEAETLHAFQYLYAKHPATPLTLYIDQNEHLTAATLALRAGSESVPLRNSRVQFFDVR